MHGAEWVTAERACGSKTISGHSFRNKLQDIVDIWHFKCL